MTDSKWQRDDNWVGSQIEDSFVMVNIDSGKYVALNASASAIWDALETPATSAEIVASLRAKFEVDEATCNASVERTLGTMSEMQLASQV